MDAAPHRLRRNEDLLDIALIIVGAASMLILAAYAHETTTGVTLDVRNALAVLLRQILIFPLQTVEGLATFAVPVAVILSNLLRRSWRTTGESLLGGLGGFLLSLATLTVVGAWAPTAIVSGLTVTVSGTAHVASPRSSRSSPACSPAPASAGPRRRCATAGRPCGSLSA